MIRRRRNPAFALAFSEAVRLVAADYADFIRTIERHRAEDDPKNFGARHAAARSCLAHLEQLLRLIGEESGTEPVRDGFALLHEARSALGPPPLLLEGPPPAGADDEAGSPEDGDDEI
jgi:hypothetical protein